MRKQDRFYCWRFPSCEDIGTWCEQKTVLADTSIVDHMLVLTKLEIMPHRPCSLNSAMALCGTSPKISKAGATDHDLWTKFPNRLEQKLRTVMCGFEQLCVDDLHRRVNDFRAQHYFVEKTRPRQEMPWVSTRTAMSPLLRTSLLVESRKLKKKASSKSFGKRGQRATFLMIVLFWNKATWWKIGRCSSVETAQDTDPRSHSERYIWMEELAAQTQNARNRGSSREFYNMA